MQPTRSKLHMAYRVPVKFATQTYEHMMDWVDAKMDRGYRLRYTIENNAIIVSHDSYEPIRHAMLFLERFRNGATKRIY